jgi:hypothetical protein
VFNRRQRSVKLAFNLAQFLLCSVVTVGVVQLFVGGSASFGPRDWPTAFLATSAENMVGVFAVTAAISLAEGAPQHARIPRMLMMGEVVSLTNTSLALLVITVLFVEPAAALLFAVPITAVFVAYRAYVSERQQHEGLEMLYESTRIMQRSPEMDRPRVPARPRAQDVPGRDRRGFAPAAGRGSGHPADERRTGEAVDMMQPIGTTLDDPKLVQCLAERRAFIAQASRGRSGWSRSSFRNAMYAPSLGSRASWGRFVANRLSDLSPFYPDDLAVPDARQPHRRGPRERPAGTVAQLAVRLQEELQHKAYHDALTGLATGRSSPRAWPSDSSRLTPPGWSRSCCSSTSTTSRSSTTPSATPPETTPGVRR